MTLGCPWRCANGRWLAHRPKSQSTAGHTLANGIGASRVITTIARDIHAAVSKAMENVRLDVAGATTDLTNEIEHGGKAVKRTLHAEAMGVRAKFGKVVGNNQLD